MKLSSLTTQDKLRLAAELDGHSNPVYSMGEWYSYESGMGVPFDADYLYSYDAIIPLIQKIGMSDEDFTCQIEDLVWSLYRVEWVLTATPSQLLDALLIATGKAEL